MQRQQVDSMAPAELSWPKDAPVVSSFHDCSNYLMIAAFSGLSEGLSVQVGLIG